MNGKENYLKTLLHEKAGWVPVEGENLLYTGFEFNSMEKGPAGGGFDGFGVKWAAPESGGGTAIPEPGYFLLTADTVCDWKKILKFPDPAAYHWKEDAKAQLAGVDRSVTCVDYGDGNGPYERLAAFMGFENALMSIAEEPEAVEELLTAIADFKIQCLDYIAEYYHPDTYTLYDDVATQQCTFMSPGGLPGADQAPAISVSRLGPGVGDGSHPPLLRPCRGADRGLHGRRLRRLGVGSALQRHCGAAGPVREPFLPGGRLRYQRGSRTDRGPAVIQAEVERCFRDYGEKPGYIFAGFILTMASNPDETWALTGVLCEQAIAYTHAHTKKIEGGNQYVH